MKEVMVYMTKEGPKQSEDMSREELIEALEWQMRYQAAREETHERFRDIFVHQCTLGRSS